MTSQVHCWTDLCKRLGIQCVAPYSVDLGDKRGTFAALLPQFGAPAGMVVDPNFSAIEPFKAELLAAGYGFSCVTLGDAPDLDSAIALLMDWGWNGTGDEPRWLEPRNGR